MSVTAKEIAEYLNLSTASVSVALNNKPGVSTQTRKRVLEVARELGYDFSCISKQGKMTGSICYVRYIHLRSPQEAPFFGILSEGLRKAASVRNIRYKSMVIYGDEDFEKNLEALRFSDCSGILLLGTDITKDRLERFLTLNIPLVLMDTWFNAPSVDCVKPNNIQGAYLATEYLIKTRKCQPGYLQSSLQLYNYEERFRGYCMALETYRMSVANSDIRIILPNMTGAAADMRKILQTESHFAHCYVADTDAQAVGAMTAFQEKGYRVPKDVAFVGFDNSIYSANSTPGLTTIDACPSGMAESALNRLLEIIECGKSYHLKIELDTMLIQRGSA